VCVEKQINQHKNYQLIALIMMNINSTRHKLCGIANSNSSRSSKIVLSLSKIIKNKIGYSQSREFCRNESRQTRRRGTEVKIGRRMKMMIGNNNSWNNLNLNNAHIRRSNDSHSCDKRCIAISSFYLPKANNNRFFGNNVQNYKTRRTYSSRSNNTELSFLSRLEDETKYTKQYIEDMLSGIDSKYKIHPSIIEREIQDGASQIGECCFLLSFFVTSFYIDVVILITILCIYYAYC
jgi:hypothetical protein